MVSIEISLKLLIFDVVKTWMEIKMLVDNFWENQYENSQTVRSLGTISGDYLWNIGWLSFIICEHQRELRGGRNCFWHGKYFGMPGQWNWFHPLLKELWCQYVYSFSCYLLKYFALFNFKLKLKFLLLFLLCEQSPMPMRCMYLFSQDKPLQCKLCMSSIWFNNSSLLSFRVSI